MVFLYECTHNFSPEGAWPTAKHGATAPTKTKPFKTATHRTKEKSTNQQNYKPNTCMATARYQ
jgi:hypothetical protein